MAYALDSCSIKPNSEEFVNWAKGVLILHYFKTGISKILSTESERFYMKILASKSCQACDQPEWTRKATNKGISTCEKCRKFSDAIFEYRQSWCGGQPSNMNFKKSMSSDGHWEVAKFYMGTGQQRNASIQDTDAYNAICYILNCKWFKGVFGFELEQVVAELGPETLKAKLEKLRNFRNSVIHSGTLQFATSSLADQKNLAIDLLTNYFRTRESDDPSCNCPGMTLCAKAIGEIKRLFENPLTPDLAISALEVFKLGLESDKSANGISNREASLLIQIPQLIECVQDECKGSFEAIGQLLNDMGMLINVRHEQTERLINVRHDQTDQQMEMLRQQLAVNLDVKYDISQQRAETNASQTSNQTAMVEKKNVQDLFESIAVMLSDDESLQLAVFLHLGIASYRHHHGKLSFTKNNDILWQFWRANGDCSDDERLKMLERILERIQREDLKYKLQAYYTNPNTARSLTPVRDESQQYKVVTDIRIVELALKIRDSSSYSKLGMILGIPYDKIQGYEDHASILKRAIFMLYEWRNGVNPELESDNLLQPLKRALGKIGRKDLEHIVDKWR